VFAEPTNRRGRRQMAAIGMVVQ